MTLSLAGCSTVDSEGGASNGTSDSNDPVVVEARKVVEAGYDGDFQDPPSEGPAKQGGKNVWVISCGQAYYACGKQADAFVEAGRELDWKVDIKDGKADPSVATGIIRQAIAARIDAVALVTFDCPSIKGALQDAKKAGMPVVNFGSIDCGDAVFGGKDPNLFSSTVKLRGSDNNADFWKEWSAARADYVIAKTDGKANALWVTERSQATHQYQAKGFEERMKECSTCTVRRVPFTFAQVPNPATLQWTTAIKSNPDLNAVIEGIDALMPLGLASAIKQSGRNAKSGLIVGGGEGFPPNFDLVRDGTQSFSVALPYGWVMWGLADSLNRVFAGDDPSTFPSQGAGWQYIDADHNLPAEGKPYEPSYDYRAAYKKIWSAS